MFMQECLPANGNMTCALLNACLMRCNHTAAGDLDENDVGVRCMCDNEVTSPVVT